jgi:hypothetical protein
VIWKLFGVALIASIPDARRSRLKPSDLFAGKWLRARATTEIERLSRIRKSPYVLSRRPGAGQVLKSPSEFESRGACC